MRSYVICLSYRRSMTADTRRAIAYIAARAISGKSSSTLYDFDASNYFHFSGRVSASDAKVYDYSTSSHIGGRLRSLYHFGHSSHIQLKLSGNQFSGYDYEQSCHFKGRVRGSRVSVYDYRPAGTTTTLSS